MTEPQRILVLRYKNADTGVWIDDILSGRRRYNTPKSTPITTLTKAVPVESTKPTHPFFTRPATLKVISPNPQLTTVVEVPTAHSVVDRAAMRQPLAVSPPFGTASPPFGPLRSLPLPVSKKVAGRDAPWPWKGVSHVTDPYTPSLVKDATPFATLKCGKKENDTSILSSRDVLKHTAARLYRSFKIEESFANNGNGFLPVPISLRLPKRFDRSGSRIQQSLLEKLSDTEAHPAARHLASKIQSYLSPFDLGRCESLAWTQKYSPASAQDVLQSGSEISVLKDWLSCHCIHNVDTGNGQKPNEKKKPLKTKKKRRRADLDDFIADSSDEEEEFGSFTDIDGDIPSPRPAQERSRVQRATPEYITQECQCAAHHWSSWLRKDCCCVCCRKRARL